jgi:multiple sugar transport system permease protein
MKNKTFATLMMTPAALFLGALVAYPVILLVYNGFYEVELLAQSERVFVGFDNFVDALKSDRIRGAASRTARYTIFALVFEFLFGFMAALGFHAMGKRSAWARTVFSFPLMIAPIVAGLLWKFLLASNFGIVNHVLADIGILDSPDSVAWLSDTDIVLYSVTFPDIWLTTSFVALIVFAGLQNIPQDLMEAARIDGANARQIFRRITLPLLRPVIAVVLIIRGVDAAKTFDLIWIQTEGGPRSQSEVLSLTIQRRMIRFGDLGEASAIATLFLMVMAILAIVAYMTVWRPADE